MPKKGNILQRLPSDRSSALVIPRQNSNALSQRQLTNNQKSSSPSLGLLPNQ